MIHFGGNTHNRDVLLHKCYGPVVRIGPNTLLFSDYAAHDAIYGFNKNIGKGDFYAGAGDPDPQKASILQLENEQAHRDRSRKIVSVAVSGNEMNYQKLRHDSTGSHTCLVYLLPCTELLSPYAPEYYHSFGAA